MGTQLDISSVIAGWQTKLLQLDRRNSLLYFRGNRSSVGIIESTPDELLDRLQRSRAGLKFPYAAQGRRTPSLSQAERGPEEHIVAGDLKTDIAPLPLQRRLLNLHRQNREWEEEQGVNVLYVALGFLLWVDEDGESAKSPLLLAPADLERTSPQDPWRLKLGDDDLQINETLRYQLSTFGLELPEYEYEVPSAYLEEVARRLAQKKDWSVEAGLALATFPFAKMAMWEDLDLMRRNGTEHPMVRALAGDQGALRPAQSVASSQLPNDEELHGGRLDDLLPVEEQFTVLSVDHSQLRAIEMARRGNHLVIHGPPGTGKSQTIANIIGTLLADGKRVLFVSEKTAALDVVKKRLEECELGGFCLDLHSHRTRKASVYQQIREARDVVRTGSGKFPLANLKEQRERLNAVARALHEIRRPSGWSVFEVNGLFAQVRSLQRVDFPLRSVGLLSFSDLIHIREATARIARRKAEFKTHKISPWRSLRNTNSRMELADELRGIAETMRKATSELRANGDTESRLLGLPLPGNPSDVEATGRIARHMIACPGIPEIWLSRDALERLERRSGHLTTMQLDRHRLEESLATFLNSGLPDLNFEELRAQLSISFPDEQRLRDSLGVAWEEQLLPIPEVCENHLREALDCTRSLREAARLVADTLLGEAGLDRVAQVRQVIQQARVALDMASVPESWFEPQGFTSIRAKLKDARDRLTKLEQAESLLFGIFEENLLQHVSREMLVRYRTDYQSFWRIFKKIYRDDQRALLGCLRHSRRLKLDESLGAVQSALQVLALREEWEAESKSYALAFGSQFSGRNSDWEAITATVNKIESWLKEWKWGPESAQRCFSIPESRIALASSLRDLDVALLAWEANSLASQGVEANLDLSTRHSLLEAGADIVARLVRSGRSLWPHLNLSMKSWRQVIDLLSLALQLRKIQDDEQELAPALRKDFEGYYDGPDTDWHRIHAAIQWARDFLDLVGDRVPQQLATQCRQPRSSDEYARQDERIIEAMKTFRAHSANLSKTFDPLLAGWQDWETPTFERLTSWLSWVEQNADSASAWLEYMTAIRDLEKLLAPRAVDALREATDDASQVPDLVLRRIYASWIDHTRERDERLRFQPCDHEALREEFQKLDRRFVHANRARVREQCFRRYPSDNGSAIEWGQLGILNRQLSMKRPKLSVRRLIEQVPQLLQALKPCLLMSPVAVSQYLSRGELATDCMMFDAVIFDEASQVFPQDAVPAIARGKQVIVVGDEKQLPPTSFFRSDMQDDEDDDEVTEDRLEGVESILDVMVGMEGGAGVHSAYLRVHYRSRHEELIRYSNHYFYGDRLLTFPSPDRSSANLGLTDVYLPNARYDAGASRTNRLEAESVVAHVFELLQNRPLDESVGVVTLSRSQANLIEELINERRMQNSSLDGRFAEDKNERFFVKNLENVQGDERDHIILSIGYGPTVGSGSVPNRFGPINLTGGERRLNVAVTRARRSLTIIRSLRPEQITSGAEGARFLRRFLEYVQDPVRAFEQELEIDPAAETESPFEEAVYRLLTERGHRVSKQVGCFGYRIDLAIAAEDGSRYDLGIECDGAAYHRAPAARDRDWLRQSVLEGLGWTIHRIWSSDWIRDPEAQILAVEHSLAVARAKAREVRAQAVVVDYRLDLASDKEKYSIEADTKLTASEVTEFRFAPYKAIDLPKSYRKIPLSDERPQTLCDLVVRIVQEEGPVHIDVVIDRIRRHYGAGRAGSQIQAAISDAAQSAVRSGRISWATLETGRGPQKSSFLDASEHPKRPEPRGPAEDDSVRPIEYVWPGEIEAGIIRVVETAFGISRGDTVLAVARAFGYARVGGNIRGAILEAVERLIKTGEVIDTPRGLTRPEL